MEQVKSKGSVLIVEDDRLLSLVTERLLEKLGHEIAGKAVDGMSAVEMVRELQPDVVLMDISLEGEMSGVDALKEIRSFSDVPVIILSGSSSRSIVEDVRSLEISDFLVKPVTADDLVGPVRRALQPHSASASSRHSQSFQRAI
ncbi:MAG: response regulator [Balneolaceae bacterium]